MRLPIRVAHEIRSRKLIAPGAAVLIALSGGPDSVALFRCMIELAKKRDLRFRLFAAHLNHGIRGSDADADEVFCERLCAKNRVPLIRAHADTPKFATKAGHSIELSARILRRMFLAQACEALSCHAVASAHHADDRIETVLYRLCRGTGAAGLRGIGWSSPLPNPIEDRHHAKKWIEWRVACGTGSLDVGCPCAHGARADSSLDSKSLAKTTTAYSHLSASSHGQPTTGLPVPHAHLIIRPLLSCSRVDVLAYLRSLKQRYCTDETNFDTGIPRNAIRKLVLPALEKKVHPGARAALWRLAEDAEAGAEAQSLRREWLLAFAEFGANRESLTLPAPDSAPPPSVEELCDVLDALLQVWTRGRGQFTRNDARSLQKLFAPRLGPRTLNLANGVVAERRGKSVELKRGV